MGIMILNPGWRTRWTSGLDIVAQLPHVVWKCARHRAPARRARSPLDERCSGAPPPLPEAPTTRRFDLCIRLHGCQGRCRAGYSAACRVTPVSRGSGVDVTLRTPAGSATSASAALTPAHPSCCSSSTHGLHMPACGDGDMTQLLTERSTDVAKRPADDIDRPLGVTPLTDEPLRRGIHDTSTEPTKKVLSRDTVSTMSRLRSRGGLATQVR